MNLVLSVKWGSQGKKMPKITADVFITKKGPGVGPGVELLVDRKVKSGELGALIQHVATNEKILTAAGLKACGGCKSGLDINIRNRFDKVINVQVEF